MGVSDQLGRLRNENVRNAAVVVLDNRSGDVLGLVGSENYFAPRSGMVNGATQPPLTVNPAWRSTAAGTTS